MSIDAHCTKGWIVRYGEQKAFLKQEFSSQFIVIKSGSEASQISLDQRDSRKFVFESFLNLRRERQLPDEARRGHPETPKFHEDDQLLKLARNRIVF